MTGCARSKGKAQSGVKPSRGQGRVLGADLSHFIVAVPPISRSSSVWLPDLEITQTIHSRALVCRARLSEAVKRIAFLLHGIGTSISIGRQRERHEAHAKSTFESHAARSSNSVSLTVCPRPSYVLKTTLSCGMCKVLQRKDVHSSPYDNGTSSSAVPWAQKTGRLGSICCIAYNPMSAHCRIE